MEMENIWRQFDTLPAEAKQEVVDFITFLQTRYRRSIGIKKTQRLKLGRVDELLNLVPE